MTAENLNDDGLKMVFVVGMHLETRVLVLVIDVVLGMPSVAAVPKADICASACHDQGNTLFGNHNEHARKRMMH